MLQLDYEEERDMALQAVELARQSGENLGWYMMDVASAYHHLNDTDSAILHYKTYFSRERTLSGRYEASAGLQRCYLQKGDFQQAAQWGCRLYDTNDSIIAQRAFEVTQRARDTYIYYRDREKEQTAWNRIKRAEEVCGDLLAPRN